VICTHASIFENGIVNEAIVLQWPVQTTLWDFWTSLFEEEGEEEQRKTLWPSGDFLVQYFHNAFSYQKACCSSWKHSKMNGTLL